MTDYPGAFKAGDWLAIILPADEAPSRVYIGELKDIDEHGIILILIDKEMGVPGTLEMFIDAMSTGKALICRDLKDRDRFLKTAFEWKEVLDKREEDNRKIDEDEDKPKRRARRLK